MKKILLLLSVIALGMHAVAMEDNTNKRKRDQEKFEELKRSKTELDDTGALKNWDDLPTELQLQVVEFVIGNKKPLDVLNVLKKLALVNRGWQRNTHAHYILKSMASKYIRCRKQTAQDVFVAACAAGDSAVVLAFIDSNIDTNKRDSSGKRPLVAAVERGQTAIVKLLLENKADANRKDCKGKQSMQSKDPARRTPLMVACEHGFQDIINLLIKHGAELNASVDENTPLAVAIKSGRKEIVQLLLQHGAKLSTSVGSFKSSSLSLAIETGRIAMVELLLNMPTMKVRPWDLIRAAAYGYDDIFLLIFKHAEQFLNQEDQLVERCFVHAATEGYTAIVQFLIDKVKSKEALNHALIISTQNDHQLIIEILMAADADPHFINGHDDNDTDQTKYWCSACMHALIQDNYVMLKQFLAKSPFTSPLFTAIVEHDCTQVERLLSEGVAVNTTDTNGMSALMLAVLTGNMPIIEVLIAVGADVRQVTTIDELSVLTLALLKEDVKIVRRLLEAGCNPNEQDSRGISLWLTAIDSEYYDIVQLFLEYAVDVNDADEEDENETALKRACAKGNVQLAKQLLEKGAIIKGTEFTIAAQKKYKEILELLIHYCGDSNRKLQDQLPLAYVVESGMKSMVKCMLDHGVMPHDSFELNLPPAKISKEIAEFLRKATKKYNKKGQLNN